MMSWKARGSILATCLVILTTNFCDGISPEYEYPVPRDSIMPGFTPHFSELFNEPQEFSSKWVVSEAKKDGVDGDLARYDGDWEVDYPRKMPIDGDQGLTFKQKAKHRAISSKLTRPFLFSDKPFYLQYEVLFQDTQECGGAYLKLLSEGKEGLDLKNLHDKTPFTIMFGPDKCGNNHKLHFIFRHKNPINGSYEEKHSKGPSKRIDELFTDGVSHLYTLIVLPDNTYRILVDHEVVIKGSLLEDFVPPVNPPAEIDDPEDKKPEDWDEREKIPDETATKPDDWDESAPRQIPDPKAVKPDSWLESEPVDIMDPSAEKPDDWDDAMDGEWEGPMVPNPACEGAVGCGPWSPPMIDNPAYKGKWSAPLIDNPKYKGKWFPKRIPNPHFFEDKNPFAMTPIVSLGFELWSMTSNVMFDNIVVTDNEEFLKKWTEATYDKKSEINNKNAGSLFSRFIEVSNENPWLWAVYTILPLIPLIFIAYYCLRSTKEEKETVDQQELIPEDLTSGDSLGEPDYSSAKGSPYRDYEEEYEEDEGDDDSSQRANDDELDNERNETMDGVRQRWNSPSTSSEQQNAMNEKIDSDEAFSTPPTTADSGISSARSKSD
uniref:Calmegin n=1 Tax=Lygus hesperus TaxID=30085 RepID=A0A0A9WSZ3_LYGHE